MNESIYNKFKNNEIEFYNYINVWIGATLFYMRCEHFKLGDNARIELLIKYLNKLKNKEFKKDSFYNFLIF